MKFKEIVFKAKPRINKGNNQININIPRKKLPKELLDDPNLMQIFKIKYRG